MRIALLANPDNIHNRRWIRFLLGRGHEVMVVCDPHTLHRPEGAACREPNWNLLTKTLAFRLTPRPWGNNLWKPLHYRPLVRDFRPDVVHGVEAIYSGPALAWSGPWPKVLMPWGSDVYHLGMRGGAAGWMVRRALAAADAITTNDENLTEFLHRHYGVEREKVMPFSWGIDLGTFRPDRGEGARRWRGELAIPPDAPVVFSARMIHPHRGGAEIVDALPHVLERHDGAAAILLAPEDEGGFRTEMRRRAERLGIAGAVRWIERWVSPGDMADLFNLADAFLSVPRTDLLAMTVLEGMACGCFPVLADLPAYRKYARDGETAALIPTDAGGRVAPETLAGAIERALADADLRRRAARTNIETMRREENAEINMAKIEKVYARAIERFRAKSGA